MATKVKLRQKKISGKRHSLYLDFYPAISHPETGKPTRREFLGRYLFDKPKTEEHKEHNKETIKWGEHVRQKRDTELNKPEIYTGYEKEQLAIRQKGELNFVEYFKKLADKRKGSNNDNWISAYKYLTSFTNGLLKFSELNARFCEQFKEHLLTTISRKSSKTTLSQNSAVSYFNKVKAAMKQAYKDGYLQSDLNAKVDCIKTQQTVKITLTIEELNRLAKTEIENTLLRRASLFIAMTGLPFKEMQNLKWGDIDVTESFGIRITMVRQKTNQPYYLYISNQAYELLGERNSSEDKPFGELNDRDRYYYFPLWLAKAGITKEITFHDLRHTYGCLQIDLGTDLYTLQGQMNHASPKDTAGYGKISNRKKQEAAEKIHLDL